MKDLLSFGNVSTVKTDQCQFGLETKADGGGKKLAKKPTRFMSNSRAMLRELDRQCQGGHEHQHLMAGRAAAAAFYPVKLLRAIVRGMANTKAEVDGVKALENDNWDMAMKISKTTNDGCKSAADVSIGTSSTIPLKGGGSHKVDYRTENVKEK